MQIAVHNCVHMDKYISATKARNNFFDLLEEVKKGPYPIHITVKGIPQAVLMSKEDFDAWMATIETLSDPKLMKAIHKGDEDLKAGSWSTLEEVEEELEAGKYLVADKGKKDYVSSNIGKSGKKRPKKA